VRADNGNETVIDVGKADSRLLWDLFRGPNYRFSLSAYDHSGHQSRRSSEFTAPIPTNPPSGDFTVVLTRPPVVSMLAPTNGSSWPEGTDLLLNASASDSDGSISRIDYYQRKAIGESDDTFLGTATNELFALIWTNAQAGRYLVSARAYDDSGASTVSDPVLVIVGAPPNDLFANRLILLDTDVTNGTTRAAGVEVNEPVISSDPPAFGETVWWNWNAPGSGPKSVIVTTQGKPATGAVLTGNALPDLAFASGDLIMTPIYSNGVFYYTTEIPFNGVVGVGYSALIDSGGQPYTIRITTPPQIAITSPPGNSSVQARSDLLLQSQATDADGVITRVDYYYQSIDGRTGLIGSSGTPPSYDVTWKQVPSGRYSITATAVDDAGAQNFSDPVTLTTGLATNDNFAQRITLTGVPILTNMSDFVAGREPGEPNSIASILLEQTVWWKWQALSNGTRDVVVTSQGDWPVVGVFTGSSVSNLTLVSTFTQGDMISSNGVVYFTSEARFSARGGTNYAIVIDSSDEPFTLAITVPPSVRITAPTNGMDMTPGGSFDVTVSASDSDGSVNRVDYFYDSDQDTGVFLGAITNSPFTFHWSGITPGIYNVSARAVDNFGARTWSTPVRLTSGRPDNDNFAARSTLFGTPVLAHVSTVAAAMEPNEPDYGGPKSGHTVWWSWTATYSGQHMIIGSATAPPVIGVFTGSNLTNLTSIGKSSFRDVQFLNGQYVFRSQTTFDAVAGSTYAILGDCLYGPGTDLDLTLTAVPRVLMTAPASGFNFLPGATIPFSANATDLDGLVTSLSLWLGFSGQPLSPIGGDNVAAYALSLSNLAAGVYTAEARAQDDMDAEGKSQQIQFTVGAAPNDQFTNRIRLSGDHVIAYGSNWVSTRELGEPLHAQVEGQNSVWWTWTPPVAGVYAVSSAGSTFSSALGIYLGPAVTNLTRVLTAPLNGSNSTDQLVFEAAAGKSYQIAVDGRFGGIGDIVLTIDRVAAPTNDNFQNRRVLSGWSTHTTGNNTNATSEILEMAHSGNPASHSVWWIWTAPANGVASIDTIGSSFDTVLSIYTGGSLQGLLPVAEDDDSGGNTTSQATFPVQANTPYQIAVDGFGGAYGTIAVNIDFVADPLAFAGLEVSAGNVSLQFDAAEGQMVIIEASDDLREWFPISTNVVSQGRVLFVDPAWGQQSHRFYRAVLDLILPPLSLQSPGTDGSRFVFDLKQADGALFVIQASDNLDSWQPVSTNTVVGGVIHFVDSEYRRYPRRFFRALRQL